MLLFQMNAELFLSLINSQRPPSPALCSGGISTYEGVEKLKKMQQIK